jgi:DNA-binding SARP family transcriptional activator
MDLLKISLLGTFRIDHPGLPAGGKIPRSIQILLAYLLLFRHRLHPREVLTGLFWGDHQEERARGCLSTALWRMRRTLEPPGVPKGRFLRTSPVGDVGFNPESNFWLDVEDLEDKAIKLLHKSTESMEPCEAQEIQDALSLYTSELLEGFFEDRIIRERERLRMLYLHTVNALLEKCGRFSEEFGMWPKYS